jgi:hypothetical protein
MSRSSAYDLLVEMVKGSPNNYIQLHEKLLAQHKPGKFFLQQQITEMQVITVHFR